MIDSIWTRTARLPRFKRLEGDLKTDVLVIGGGITGLLCAWMLKRAGADCAVVEAGRICGGTTGGTTGKITAQHGLIYRRLLREFGPEAARLYRQAQEAALERYRALCRGAGQLCLLPDQPSGAGRGAGSPVPDRRACCSDPGAASALPGGRGGTVSPAGPVPPAEIPGRYCKGPACL